nr:MAG TPA: hypothetical protein [Inoviridae sp.]
MHSCINFVLFNFVCVGNLGGCSPPFFTMLKLVLILFIWRLIKRLFSRFKNKNKNE